jgi:ribulose-5-phosphate 4-epimerase/fuculose-1-phosphate aldolase
MNIQVAAQALNNPLSVSEAEWNARLELAAAYRLMAHWGICDLAHNHLCVRVPDEPDALLIKHSDAFFDEITASSLVKFDFEGNPRQEGFSKLRGGGLVIHAGIMAARPDINATIHSHTAAIMGVGAQKYGLLPINQHAMHFQGKIAYHAFGGFEFDIRQRAPLLKDLGDKTIAILRNHGSLVCGPTIGAAMVQHHQLEIACQGQIAALTAGHDEIVLIDPEVQKYAIEQTKTSNAGRGDGGKDWKGMLRMADRLFPDYRN